MAPKPLQEPDLVVASLGVDQGTVGAGARVTLSATVRNRGAGEGAATTLRWYRSPDSTIAANDTEVGSQTVSAPAAGADASASIELAAPGSSGTYYYGACVDAVSGESDTANNCSASVQLTVSDASPPPQGDPSDPDLVVVAPSTSDSRPAAGGSFTLSATVRNDGNSDAPAILRYYHSTDAAITTTDAGVGTDAVATLAPRGSASESVELAAPATPGKHYYGACVDAVAGEADTTNNCSASVQVTVSDAPPPPQGDPDLVVAPPLVTDSRPAAGASFTLSATVRNDGNGAAPATTLRYYRSTDAAITTADTAVGTDTVAALAASGGVSGSVDLTAPSNSGTYYYGACVDTVAGETDTTDNCSTSVQVTVAAAPPPPQRKPDLVVAPPSTSDRRPIAGGSFTLSATVRNAGAAAAPATTLRYYRSTDAAITTADTEVGSDTVASLAAAATAAESVELTAPADPGTYYYGACVDTVADEADSTNNCSAALQVEVVERPLPPDLVVEHAGVTPSSIDAGDRFVITVTVRNRGAGDSPVSPTLRYYYSLDDVISSDDREVGTDFIGPLAASGRTNEALYLNAPSAGGTYYYGACVGTVPQETSTTNNCSAAAALIVTVPPPEPDLVVAAPAVSDGRPAAGASFTLSATVRNAGAAAAPATTLRYYRSTDAAITTADTEVGTDAVTALAAAATAAESVDLTAPANPGTYYYGACVEAVTGESDTTNNCSTSVQVTVPATVSDAPPPPRGGNPDLVVAAPAVSDGRPDPGASFTLSATVRNDGDGAAPATTLRYYRSTDAAITTADAEVGSDAVTALAAAATAAESVDLTAPADPGTYYYGACVAAVAGESDTSNNCSAAVTVTVATNADLVVATPSVTDSRPAAGASFTLSATVRNDGNSDALATTLRFYRSAYADFRRSSIQVGTAAVEALAASQSGSGSVELTAPANPGTYYYGASVDAVAGEADRTNNYSESVRVEVVSQAPDLVVQFSAIPARGVFTEATIAIEATVRNGGADDAPASTLRFYRSADATITTSDTALDTAAVAQLAGAATASARLAVTVSATPGTYYYGACVDAVAGEADSTNNCSAAAQVEVVERPLPPDLVVEHAGVTPSSVDAGDQFLITVTVRNGGTGDSPVSPTLRYYYSLDAVISSDDREVGTDFVGALAAGRSTDEALFLNAPPYGGTYYYGACVPTVPHETNTTNNCSSAAALTVAGEPRPRPDLVVESPYATIVSPVPAQAFTVGARVRNNGTADAAATTLRWRRSSDATITASDTEVDTSAVDGLSGYSGSSNESVQVTAPSDAGTYYYGACVDAVSDESDTTNNCSSSVTVTVSVPPPFTAYYGAYALTIIGGSDNSRPAVGLVVDQRSEQEALNAAQLACQAAGGSVSGCSNANSFQQCAAVVFGTDHLTSPAQSSTLWPHDASTLAAAESDALTDCRSQWRNCTIAASGCNSPPPGSGAGR